MCKNAGPRVGNQDAEGQVPDHRQLRGVPRWLLGGGAGRRRRAAGAAVRQGGGAQRGGAAGGRGPAQLWAAPRAPVLQGQEGGGHREHARDLGAAARRPRRHREEAHHRARGGEADFLLLFPNRVVELWFRLDFHFISSGLAKGPS
ncbi:hypothetical protein FOCC_FOCC017515 [Frankliniella occidentalis]|nr:hypothetical protein FOCC_FOCC017515 [Frankliniella occidentalis]